MGFFSRNSSLFRRNRSKQFFCNIFLFEKKNRFPWKKNEKILKKVHGPVEIFFQKKLGNWTLYLFLGSVLHRASLSGTKILHKDNANGSAGAYRYGTLTLRKRQKAQIVLKFLEMETHILPEIHGPIQSSRSKPKSFYLYLVSPWKTLWLCPLRQNPDISVM